MKPAIYQTRDGFDILTGAGVLHQVVKFGDRWHVQKVGPVGPAFRPSGRLVHGLPPFLRRLFFSVQKNRQ